MHIINYDTSIDGEQTGARRDATARHSLGSSLVIVMLLVRIVIVIIIIVVVIIVVIVIVIVIVIVVIIIVIIVMIVTIVNGVRRDPRTEVSECYTPILLYMILAT